jgi:hypothetical protein
MKEGARLGVFHPSDVGLTGRDLIQSPFAKVKDDEGLCVTGCETCRTFRNEVRAALLAEEAAEIAAIFAPLDEFLAAHGCPCDEGSFDYDDLNDNDWDAGYTAGFEVGSAPRAGIDVSVLDPIERITSAINLAHTLDMLPPASQERAKQLIAELLG